MTKKKYSREFKDFYIDHPSGHHIYYGVIIHIEPKTLEDDVLLDVIDENGNIFRVNVYSCWKKNINDFGIGEVIIFTKRYYYTYYDAEPKLEDYKLSDTIIKIIFTYLMVGEDAEPFFRYDDYTKAKKILANYKGLSKEHQHLFLGAFVFNSFYY